MQKYETLNHEKFRLRYHIIFSTRYRKKCLNQIRESILNAVYRAQAMQSKWKVEVAEIDKDHIHMLIKATPTDTVAKIVHKLKQVTTYDIWQKHYDYMKTFYWGSQHYLWTRGYFCSTIGDISEKTIKNYIENQG